MTPAFAYGYGVGGNGATNATGTWDMPKIAPTQET
jgi:hypothetical protein